MPEEAKKDEPKKDEKPQSTIDKTYYLVVVGDDAPEIVRCEDRSAFLLAVQKKVLQAKEEIYAFGFMGERVSIAPPVPACAVQIDGEVMRLGDETPQFDESGRITPLIKPGDEA